MTHLGTLRDSETPQTPQQKLESKVAEARKQAKHAHALVIGGMALVALDAGVIAYQLATKPAKQNIANLAVEAASGVWMLGLAGLKLADNQTFERERVALEGVLAQHELAQEAQQAMQPTDTALPSATIHNQ